MKKTRREFVKKMAASLAGAVLVVMIPKPVNAQRIHKIDVEKPLPDWMDHYYAYVVDTTKCIGCGACVRACKRENGVLDSFFRTWVERYIITDDDHVYIDSPNGGYDGFQPKEIKTHLVKSVIGSGGLPYEKERRQTKSKVSKGFFVPKICNHCRNTPCTQVCPVHASYQSPTGAVLVDKKRCIGCGYCVQACPYGSRYIDPRTNTADKCTWCFHRTTKELKPACVLVCPTGTRKFGDLKEADSEIKDLIQNLRVNVLKPELNTEPFCFYIGLDMAVR